MKRRYFVHFDITPNCMQAGVCRPEDPPHRDVFDHLATKLRNNEGVRQMLQQIVDGKLKKVCIGVGKEYDE